LNAHEHLNIEVLDPTGYPSPLKRWVDESEPFPRQVFVQLMRGRRMAFSLNWQARAKNSSVIRRRRAPASLPAEDCVPDSTMSSGRFFELRHAYRVKEVLGFRWGYQWLDLEHGANLVFTTELADRIHLQGGTIPGTSRGPVDKARAMDNLIRRRVNILFTIGGDGTQRGAREFSCS
jgi:hypothetical protein